MEIIVIGAGVVGLAIARTLLAAGHRANWRIPRLLGRLVPETSQTAMLGRYSNRLSTPGAQSR